MTDTNGPAKKFDYARHFGTMRTIGEIVRTPAERAWTTAMPREPEAHRFVVWLGCNVVRTAHIAEALSDVLRHLDVDFVALGGPSHCCGIVHRTHGDAVNRRQHAAADDAQVRRLQARAAAELVPLVRRHVARGGTGGSDGHGQEPHQRHHLSRQPRGSVCLSAGDAHPRRHPRAYGLYGAGRGCRCRLRSARAHSRRRRDRRAARHPIRPSLLGRQHRQARHARLSRGAARMDRAGARRRRRRDRLDLPFLPSAIVVGAGRFPHPRRG